MTVDNKNKTKPRVINPVVYERPLLAVISKVILSANVIATCY